MKYLYALLIVFTSTSFADIRPPIEDVNPTMEHSADLFHKRKRAFRDFMERTTLKDLNEQNSRREAAKEALGGVEILDFTYSPTESHTKRKIYYFYYINNDQQVACMAEDILPHMSMRLTRFLSITCYDENHSQFVENVDLP